MATGILYHILPHLCPQIALLTLKFWDQFHRPFAIRHLLAKGPAHCHLVNLCLDAVLHKIRDGDPYSCLIFGCEYN